MNRLIAHIRRFDAETRGTTLVELAFVIPLFLLFLFGLIDFGRLSYHWVAAEKASGIAARIATVRPAACGGVPETYGRGSNLSIAFGTNCSFSGGTCNVPTTVSCVGDPNNPTAAEVWSRISPLLPNDAEISNLRFIYSPDGDSSDGVTEQIGFLGGPYVPTVTVEIHGLVFKFATPLSGLANLASGASGSTISNDIPIPTMSVSIPGEDLNVGTKG